jgi:rare lipoprotein A
MYDMTAAHKTLPMNTIVKVDNLENGKSIIVRINDRGPFVKGRIIDLSNKAAHEIDMVRKGTSKVKITVLGYNGEIENKDAPYLEVPQTKIATNQEIDSGVDVLEPLEIKESNITTTVAVIPKAIPSADQKVSKIENKSTLATGRFSLQIGAFSIESGAIKTKNNYQGKFKNNRVDTEKVFINGRTLHKVFVKGFNSYEEAQAFKNSNSLNNAVISNN